MHIVATNSADSCPKGMEQTSQQQTNLSSQTDAKAESGKFINLRPFLGLRLGLFAVAMVIALLYVGGMTFGNGTIEAPQPTDPVVAQAAWQDLVSDTLADKGTADQDFSLPTSDYQSIGLLPIRAGSN